jgi:hypothetical protein
LQICDLKQGLAARVRLNMMIATGSVEVPLIATLIAQRVFLPFKNPK